jgi:precorrin-3B methylase
MAAKAGAPLVNDFVLTSETDASRIERLAGAGFGVVIYNIEGSRLQPILEILDTSRPCVLARDVSREGEVIMAMTASDMKGAHPNGHRFTLLVASKNSYIKSGRVVTKRGYEVKYNY